MSERLGALGPVRATAVAACCALAVLGRGGCATAPPDEPGPVVVIEPALFVGMVELTGDSELGFGVLLSTATEEVLVADGAVARRLVEHEGEVVAVEGRLLERPNTPATIVVREFRVLGTETREPAAAAGVQRVSAGG
jgi:hypothetical protein